MAQEKMLGKKLERTPEKTQEKTSEIEECLDMLLQYAKIQPTEEVHILDAVDKVLAEEVKAGISVPPYPKSAMDGYAVCASDLAGTDKEHPLRLPVKGKLMAGDYEEIPYEKNTAIRVMTGAFIPAGYDAVIRQEDTDYGEDTVTIYTDTKPYMNYCKMGEDIQAGQTLLSAHTRLTPLHIGLLAEVGIEKVKVYKPLRVAILCTGSELMNVGQPLQPGKIYNNISYLLSSAIRREGLEVSAMQICEDEEELLLQRLREALEISDLVITTGGVSVGQKDLIPEVLQKLGADILFRRANIQPGTPTTGSVKDGKIILSLSGNPYAATVNFEIYFWPLAAKMMGHESFDAQKRIAVLKTPYPKKNHARRFLRAYYANGEVTLPSAVHASSVISNLMQCNCYIDLEKGREVQVGENVRVRMIKGLEVEDRDIIEARMKI
ncbi:MAG: molybdopterin molybdotransferase MoeA [Lachnospiraceae bacterium]|nr:molybdopterin molybdotransferase MoeA [Lachnospiraceae bacterium]